MHAWAKGGQATLPAHKYMPIFIIMYIHALL